MSFSFNNEAWLLLLDSDINVNFLEALSLLKKLNFSVPAMPTSLFHSTPPFPHSHCFLNNFFLRAHYRRVEKEQRKLEKAQKQFPLKKMEQKQKRLQWNERI